MASEMQERIARALFESRLRRTVTDENWAQHFKMFRDLSADWPEYLQGSDGVSDAFRDALAVMRAMREPTPVMLDAGVAYALNVTLSGAGGWSEYIRAKHQHMLDAEIAAAATGDSHDR